MITHTTHSEAETEAVACALAAQLQPGTVVALNGELGAGKTCFVRGLAQGLGIEPSQVSSPTFVIEHRYGPKLVHIDAYRLKGEGDLQEIGWEELIARRDVVIAVEWADRIHAALPAGFVRVSIAHGPDGTRVIEIE